MKVQDIKKVCKKCKAKCCKIGTDFTKKEMLDVIKKNPKFKEFFIKVSKNHYEVKPKKGRCAFLEKDYSCKIHNLRPLVCKCWPTYIEGKKSKRKYYLIQCPLTPHLSKYQIRKMFKQANKVPKDVMEGVKTNLPKIETDLLQKRFNKFKKKNIK